jgi:O-antigen/teichoic acid export membrane protein
MLNQSGRVALTMVDNVGVLVANVLLNMYLIPRYGLIGSAFAWMISLVVVNTVQVWQVRKTMGMLPFDSASGKGMIAALAALVVALAVSMAASGPAALLIGAPLAVAVYGGALVLLGLPDDDRILIRQLRHRGRPGLSQAEAKTATLVAAGRS